MKYDALKSEMDLRELVDMTIELYGTGYALARAAYPNELDARKCQERWYRWSRKGGGIRLDNLADDLNALGVNLEIRVTRNES